MTTKDNEARLYHKDNDEDAWGDAEQRDAPRGRGTLTATITVRFSAEEAAVIRGLSQARHLSYSDVVREAIRNYARPLFSVEAGVITASFAQPAVPAAHPRVDLGGNLSSVQNNYRGLAAPRRE